MHIANPVIPFCGPLGTRLTPGTIIRVNGNILPSATCFAINLQTGPSVNPRDDVALHLSAVFSQPARIVRNSIQSNRWGPEESYGGFPLPPGGSCSFEFMILVEGGEFRIAINGLHFTEFRHRLPYEAIGYIAVDGDVQINSINVDSGSGGAPIFTPMPDYGGMKGGPFQPPISSGLPYPSAGACGMPIGFPVPGGDLYPPPAYSAQPQGPPPGAYVPPTASAYPQVASGAYYPATSAPTGYPAGGAGGYSAGAAGYPPGGQSGSKGSGLGGIGGMLSGLTAGVAGTAIGSKLLGKHGKHDKHGHGGFLGGMTGIPGMSHQQSQHHGKKSGGIPIAGLAAGAGAAALGTYMLAKANPLKKAKKMFKHKHKMGKWSHKGWGSSSSSSSEEE